MGLFSGTDNVDPGSGGSTRPPLPEGYYPQLMVERTSAYPSTKKKHQIYWKADCEVLVAITANDGSTVPAGKGGSFIQQIKGNDHTYQDDNAVGAVKLLLGACHGLADKPSIKAKITEAELERTTEQELCYAGYVFAARVTHKVTGNGKTIALFDVFPCEGAPKLVPGKQSNAVTPAGHAPAGQAPAGNPPPVSMPQTQATAGGPPPVSAPAAAPPPAVAPPPAKEFTPGPGEAWHTDPAWAGKGWVYETATGNPRQLRGW